MNYQCPNCGGQNIQSLSVVYEQNKFSSSYIGRSLKGGVIRGRGVHISDLGKKAAPPVPNYGIHYSWVAVGAALAFYIIMTMVIKAIQFPDINLGFLSLLVGIAVGVGARQEYQKAKKRHNDRIHYPAMKKWRQSFYCYTCGWISNLNA